MPQSRAQIARESYLAFTRGERAFFEDRLSEDFNFSSPPDPVKFVRLIEAGDEVIVSYELRRPDCSGGRNTEVLTFDRDDRIVRTEVYFGWSVTTELGVPAD